MNSFDINHVLNDSTDLGQYDLYAIPDNGMLQLSCKFDESKWNPYWVTMLMSSSGTDYFLNEHGDVDQYGPYAIPSEVMPCYSYAARLVNQFEIPIDSSY